MSEPQPLFDVSSFRPKSLENTMYMVLSLPLNVQWGWSGTSWGIKVLASNPESAVSSMLLMLTDDSKGLRTMCELATCVPASAIKATVIICSCMRGDGSTAYIPGGRCLQKSTMAMQARLRVMEATYIFQVVVATSSYKRKSHSSTS